MSAKTSQLQIRVSPEQKSSLRRLAADAGQSISAYVLATVLPPTHQEFGQRVRAVRGATDRRKGLSDLAFYLSQLGDSEFSGTVREIDLDGFPPLLQNHVAAMVEDEARTRGASEPSWTHAVDSPPRPHFAWDLRSLRPHLLRVTPAAFKRRNIYTAVTGATRPAERPSERVSRLLELSSELAKADVLAELCLVGGAVITIALRAKPETRRMRSLFRETSAVRDAADVVAGRRGLAPDWLSNDARGVVASGGVLGHFHEDPNLRIFTARPDYTFAMKVASSPLEIGEQDEASSRADVRYLLRVLDVLDAPTARALLHPYFNERQLPPDVDARLIAVLR